MNQLFFEILYETGLLSEGKISQSAVDALSPTQIFDIAAALASVDLSQSTVEENPRLAHSASLSLAGERTECISLPCRIARLNSLTRFALLYSDRVYIHNPFYDYLVRQQSFKREHAANLRSIFHQDLSVIKELEPLRDRDYVLLFSPPYRFHKECLADTALGTGAGTKLKKAREELAEEYLSKTKVTVEFDSKTKNCIFHLNGPKSLYEHGGFISSGIRLPNAMLNRRRFLDAVRNGRKLIVPAKLRSQLPFHEILANEVVSNVCAHLLMNLVLDSHFLSENSLHVSFLGRMSGSSEMDRRNLLALQYLTSEVPFVEDLDIRSLIKLREREKEALLNYRRALN